MILKIDINSLFEIVKKTYSADHILLLKAIEEGIDLTSMCKGSEKFSALYTGLIRKGLISETDNKITLIGQELLRFAESEGEEKMEKITMKEDEFAKFWKVFPSSDIFEYKGVKFSGSRALKINKEECKLKLKNILNTGEFTIDEIVQAIEYDVKMKKENSLRTKTNKLSYIQNSLTYLRQYSFLPFLELIREGKNIEETQTKFDGINI